MWTKEAIKELLIKSDKAVVRGVISIYEFQTFSEKMTSTTNEENGVGFNGADAEILSSFALGAKKYGSLTEKQMAIARKRIMKYAGQLAKIANDKTAAVAA